MPEKFKVLSDFFRSTSDFLHGTSSLFKMGLLLFFLLLIAVDSILEITGKLKEKNERLKTLEEKHPRLFSAVYSAKARFFLLAIVVVLLCVDWRDTTTISPPIVQAPPVPGVVFSSSEKSKSNAPRWNERPGIESGPIGPISAVELVQTFHRPCLVKITTAKDKPNLGSTIRWLLTEISKCEMYYEPFQSADKKYPEATNVRGLVVHWNESNDSVGKQVAYFFQSSGYIVRESHQLPPNSPPALIWLDFGPGDPVRDEIQVRPAEASRQQH
jgi:hypothetical protein